MNTNNIDERSGQVKDILGKAPNWMIRWGITLIFVILIFIFVGASLISYNDIVVARVTITTKIPPAYIEAKTQGRLEEIFVKTDENVLKNQLLAEIENNANLKDVLYVEDKIENFIPTTELDLDSIENIFPLNKELGEIQSKYSNFTMRLKQYLLYNSLNPNKNEIAATTTQIKMQYDLLGKQQSQLKLFEEQLKISKRVYQRNKTLYEKGVISSSELDNAQKIYLSDRQKYENLKTAVSNSKITIANLSSSITQTNIVDQQSGNEYEQGLYESLQSLKNAISDWEFKYVLKSPIKGKVTLFDVWNKYQNVNAGEVLFTIVPEQSNDLIGKLTMPIQNSGKVKVGQEVIIKLNNYPYQEWGSLKGKIVSISSVPKKNEASYTVYIEINSLNTSYNKKIDFKQEMQGSAEIITEKLTVLERIFYQLRDLFSRNNQVAKPNQVN